MDQTETISLRKRCWLWAAAWGAAAIIMAIPYPITLVYAWLFPLGLLGLILPSGSEMGLAFPTIVGWGFYVLLTACGIRQDKRARYFVAYTVLCVLLLVNVGGCHYAVATMKM